MILSRSRHNDSRKGGHAWLRRSISAVLLVGLAGCGAAPVESVSIADSALAQGLVAHWPFDESSGATVGDSSGNGHNGQLTGGDNNFGWGPTTGRFGGGLHLRTGDSVTISPFPDVTTDWTVSVWIKMSKEEHDALTDQRERAVLLSTERPSMGGWEIEFDPRPGFEYLEASYYAAGGYPILRVRGIDIERWMHYTAVFDWNHQRFHLYRDGVPVDSAMMPSSILSGDTTLNIGRWSGQGARPIAGVIDDFAIWMRALSADEVAALDKRPVPDAP